MKIMSITLRKLTLLLVLFINAKIVDAYVENVVHGYPNCMSCHIAPTGGGILTDYGRVLSSELMSTFKTKKFQNPFFGLVHNTPYVKWGGHVRTLQSRKETKKVKEGSLFLMQNNLETAVYVQEFTFVATIGTREGPKDRVSKKGEFLSERHYLLWSIGEDSKMRVGKFRQSYGLNDPNHTRFTKQFLGFGSQSESYQLEVSKFYETLEVIFSASLGRIDIPKEEQIEKNISTQLTYYLWEKSRLSTNILLGESPSRRRSLYGVNGIVPIPYHFYIQFQLDYELAEELLQNPHERKRHALYGNFILGKKVISGLHGYFIYEHAQTNLDNSRLSLTTSPGVGLRWHPIAHFDIQFEHQYRTSYRKKDLPEHHSSLTAHLYY